MAPEADPVRYCPACTRGPVEVVQLLQGVAYRCPCGWAGLIHTVTARRSHFAAPEGSQGAS